MHRVRFVGETELPPGVAWAVVRAQDGQYVFVKQSADWCDILEALDAAGPPTALRAG